MFHQEHTAPQPRANHHIARPAPQSPLLPVFRFPENRKPGRFGLIIVWEYFPFFRKVEARAWRPATPPRPLTGPQNNHSIDRDHRKKRKNSGFFSGFPEEMGLPKPQHPCAPRPTCRPGTDAGHRRPTLDHLEPHGEHRDGIARPFARTCVMRGTYPPFFIVPTRQRGNAVKDAPASVFFGAMGCFRSIHGCPGGCHPLEVPHPLALITVCAAGDGKGGTGAGEARLAAACGRSLRSAW